MKKRQFIKDVLLTTLAAPIGLTGLAQTFKKNASLPANELAKVEDFWLSIRNQYLLKPDYINLENGYYNFLPQPILDKYIEHIKMVNYQCSYYMRTVQWDNKDKVAARLAKLGGCSAEEIIITRNTTESIYLVVSGFDWQKGD